MASVPPSDLIINGLDLTTVFARYISGPKASPTGIFINGQDLCNVFAPYIIGQKANPTGIYVGGGGIDICNIFLPINAVIPIAPTNLSVSSVTNSTASLSFNTVAGAISYLASSNTGITCASTSSPLLIPGLAAGTLYTVSLRTINPWGMSNPTKSINVTTYPVIPTLTTTISDVSMTIVYPAFNTLTYYSATVTPTLGGSSSIFSSTTATLSITGLSSYTGYKIAYLTSNIAGQSIPSIVNVTTAPSPPTNLVLSNITTTSATLGFSTALGATSYLVLANINSITLSTFASISSPINMYSLLSGTIYNLYIKSISSNGSSNPTIINLTTIPSAPTNLSLSNITVSSASLNFSTSVGAISYLVSANINSITLSTFASTTSPINITGLLAGTTYNLNVQSISSIGYSDPSIVNLTTIANPPTGLSVKGLSSNNVTINFTTATGATSYTATASPGTITTTSTTSPIIITGLSALTTYTITIKSVNSGGSSQSSSSVIVTTVLVTSFNTNSLQFSSISVSNNIGYISGVNGNYLYISKNSGSTWTSVYGGSPIRNVSISCDTGQYQLFCNDGGSFYSRNSGDSFGNLNGNYFHSASVSYSGQDEMFSKYPHTVYTSSDSFSNYYEVEFANSPSGWTSSYCSGEGAYRIASVDSGHIYISNNRGRGWSQGTTDTRGWQSVSMSGTGQYCSGRDSSNYCWRSSNYGSYGSWSVAFTNANGPIMYSSTGQYQVVNLGGVLNYSTDYGSTWSELGSLIGYGAYTITKDGWVVAVSNTTAYVFKNV